MELEIKYKLLSDLLPYARNARTHSEAQVKQIAASIKEFGFVNPILISAGNDIVAGHGRALAAELLGMDLVPTITLGHLSDTQRRAYVLADNRLAELSGWDMEMLKTEIAELDEQDFEISMLGFGDYLDVFEDEKTKEGLTDPDDIPEVEQNFFKVNRGDVWQIGEHRLMCGDSTDSSDIDRLFDGTRSDFCFTSPPYLDQRDYNGGKDLSTKKIAQFLKAPCDLFAVNLGIQRKDREIYPYWNDYIASAKGFGHKFLSWNVWNKGHAGSIGNQTAMFAITHEWILVFGKYKKLNDTHENKTAGENANHIGTRQKDGTVKKSKDRIIKSHSNLPTVYNCYPQKARDDINHPARFPVEFAEGYIEACSSNGSVVYEPFAGSGSTLIACEKTGRKCYGMELDEHYCSVIIKRWQDFTGKTAIKIGEK